jgi:hypothetical protein
LTVGDIFENIKAVQEREREKERLDYFPGMALTFSQA